MSSTDSNSVKTHYRACHLCEAICGLEIKTEGEAIVSIKGDKQDPFSRGHICPKATALEDIHTDPDRLRQPVKKVDGQWQKVSWDEAFSFAASKLANIQRQHGESSAAIYAGNPNVHNYGSLTHASVFRKALKSKVTFSATSLDQLPHHLSAYGMYGHQHLLPIPDIDHTHFMLIIGGNPLASNGSIMTVPDVKKRLQAIQHRGGKFVVIDPRRTETADIADQHHFIRPGSDVFLLLAMIRTLFDEGLVDLKHLASVVHNLEAVKALVQPYTPELAAKKTGVSAASIRELARQMKNNQGAVCYGRMGVSVQEFGAVCQWAIQIINIISGNLDSRGGALVCSPAFGYVKPGESGAGSFGRWHSRVSGLPEFGGELPSSVLAEEILTEGEGQIKALITVAGNPVLSAPNGRELDQAFECLDFMMSIDLYINETTRHADIIFPPTSPLEHDHYDVSFNRLAVRNVARVNEPVFEPKPDCLHDWQILNGLGEALAKQKNLQVKALPAPDILIDMGIQMGHYSAANGSELALTMDKLREYPHGLDLGPLEPSLKQRLCTEDGFIQLLPDFIVQDMPRVQAAMMNTDNRGLLLIGRRHVRSNNSWMHNSRRLVKGKPRWQLLMHPDDLKARGIDNNASVKITSRVGSIETLVLASDQLMPGVVSLPHGWGHQRQGVKLEVAAAQKGVSMNDITDNKFVDVISGNAVLNGVPVTVEAVIE